MKCAEAPSLESALFLARHLTNGLFVISKDKCDHYVEILSLSILFKPQESPAQRSRHR